MQISITSAFILFLFYSAFFIQEEKRGELNVNRDKMEQISPQNLSQNPKDSIIMDSAGCNPDIWKHVYNPERLKVINKCITVTGLIEESNSDADGDQHMLLKLDKGQKKLLTKKNFSKKSGDLVIEAVCINNITLPKVKGACKGYVNHVQIPKVGNHVAVTGSYVIDSHNGWSEIHPITKIEIKLE